MTILPESDSDSSDSSNSSHTAPPSPYLIDPRDSTQPDYELKLHRMHIAMQFCEKFIDLNNPIVLLRFRVTHSILSMDNSPDIITKILDQIPAESFSPVDLVHCKIEAWMVMLSIGADQDKLIRAFKTIDPGNLLPDITGPMKLVLKFE